MKIKIIGTYEANESDESDESDTHYYLPEHRMWILKKDCEIIKDETKKE